jgi:protein-S-isoprenylcysteine O-methyltransferase Ste14
MRIEMSKLSFLNGQRGEYLVVLQFVLLFAFIATPVWHPIPMQTWLDLLAVPRKLIWFVAGLISIVFVGAGMLNLRDNLTPLPYPVDHNQLVQHGIYRWVRHPLYASQLFIAFGWVLYSLSVTHLVLFVIGFVFFDYKASKEEAWLTKRHPEYASYAQRVRKFIPFVY